MGESGRKNVCKLHTTLSSETPLPPLRRSPSLHFLWYSCHRQLWAIQFAARRTARRGRLGNGTCLPLINIPLIPTIIILFSWLYKGKFNFEFSLPVDFFLRRVEIQRET